MFDTLYNVIHIPWAIIEYIVAYYSLNLSHTRAAMGVYYSNNGSRVSCPDQSSQNNESLLAFKALLFAISKVALALIVLIVIIIVPITLLTLFVILIFQQLDHRCLVGLWKQLC